jgi:hypothetical protein
MQGGARYQNQVTAWLAAKMLAERPAAPIVPRGKLSYLAAESGEAVDDVMPIHKRWRPRRPIKSYAIDLQRLVFKNMHIWPKDILGGPREGSKHAS